MLNDTLIRVPRTNGLTLLHKRGAKGARELSSWRLRVIPGAPVSHKLADEEMIVVLQQGRGTFRAGDKKWPVSRDSVFAGRGSAVYVPPGVEFTAEAETPLEAVAVSTPAPAGGSPAFVGPDEVTVNPRGRGTYSREVHDLFVRDPYVRRLMVGETFNPPGNWSSYPPHKHDGKDGEPKLEEVYHYRIDPPQGFGHQMIYTADGEAVVHAVRDGDAVILPYGYHPVSTPPGYKLYYLWAIAGEERRLALHEDPDHRWVHDIPAPAPRA
jgi:5-deoxy-glucuronate isomerase